MAISREEIESISQAVASRVMTRAGLVCDCKNIEPLFLQAIERDLVMLPTESPVQKELFRKLIKLAKGCGYERTSDKGWVQFPEQERVLQTIGPYTIVQEHDDGDLTIDSKNWGLAVVTTEGQVFTKPTMPLEIH